MSRSNPWKQKPRSTRHTTLIVVEGDTEKVFVKHIVATFGRNCGTRVTIESAFGGSGDSILTHAIKLCPGFDRRAVLYDQDNPPTKKGIIQESNKLGIQHLISEPAIEGVLLSILGYPVPRQTKDCKRELAARISNSITQITTFQRYFSEALLRERIKNVQILRELIALLSITSAI